ncbi:MAG TPA: 3-hydroxyacyl-CoA dehydrogenase NAD-binding domain-containing protein [Candidatus Tyrphobacter sp.]
MDERIVVVGGGAMGAGIAAVASRAGYRVAIVEPDARALARARERAPEADFFTEVPEDDTAVLAIEAVPERLEAKVAVFTAMEQRLPHAVLATNTSSLCVREIANASGSPERVIGLHFFNPPEKMALVEIVRAPSTGENALALARRFVEQIAKTGIVTADTPGFVVNRVARPFYLQALLALVAQVAPVDELDALARGMGFRMGPFELMDFIGLDVNLATSESIYERTQYERLAPVEMQRALVAQGRLGRKSGAGFYSYDTKPPRIDLHRVPRAAPDARERVVVLGAGGLADEMTSSIAEHFAPVTRVERDDELEDLTTAATILVDVGDGSSDRAAAIERLDASLPPECVIFVDAYASDPDECAKRMAYPDRLIGYGILGSLERQAGVEIVDSDAASDDTLALAQEMFEAIGHGVALVANVPGLFLGRVVGGIVNEAVAAVHEGVASAEDVDTAMKLGTNYPLGPIEWGREIGGGRIARILRRLAEREGEAFLPNRTLWVLDVEDRSQVEAMEEPVSWLPSMDT